MNDMGSPELSRPQEPTTPIVETNDSVSYLGVKLPKAQNRDGIFVPDRARYADFTNDPFSLDMQKQIAVSLHQGDALLIEGGTSIGKTTTVRKMAAELGYEVHYANLNGATDVEDLMGKYIPNPHRTEPTDPEYIFADGRVTSGLRPEEGRVKVILLDEYNSAAPNIVIRLHEVLDGIQRGEKVVLSEDASEAIAVDKTKTKVIALMNPPGKGYFGREPLDPAQLRRWVYLKAPSELSDEAFQNATDSLFTLEPQDSEIPQEEYLFSREPALLPEQLPEIPGMVEILAKYKEFHQAAKSLVKERSVGADQPQPFTFDDRMEPRRVRDFVLAFYNGDVNATFQSALGYYYANKLESEADKAQLRELIALVEYTPPETASQRRAITDEKKEENRGGSDVIPEGDFNGPRADILQAENIMGEDFLGPAMVREVFGVNVPVPDIPFSKEELRNAKELNQSLILRIDTLGRTPLTMRSLNTVISDKLEAAGKGKFLYDTSWYEEEDFYKNGRPKAGWALVSKDVIPGTTSKNYFEQTEAIVGRISELFRGVSIPDEYSKAVLEFQNQRGELSQLMQSDWQEAAKRLSGLKLNQLTRQTPVEAAYDLAVNLLYKNRRLLEGKYAWTKEQTSDGRLVFVGHFDADGARLDDWDPGYRYDAIGVVLSRYK